MNKISLQEYADKALDPAYRQTLKSLEEALAALDWPNEDRPKCCEQEVTIRSFLGGAYFAQCECCRKFLADVTGPHFGNSWVQFLDGEKVDIDTPVRWITGTEEPAA